MSITPETYPAIKRALLAVTYLYHPDEMSPVFAAVVKRIIKEVDQFESTHPLPWERVKIPYTPDPQEPPSGLLTLLQTILMSYPSKMPACTLIGVDFAAPGKERTTYLDLLSYFEVPPQITKRFDQQGLGPGASIMERSEQAMKKLPTFNSAEAVDPIVVAEEQAMLKDIKQVEAMRRVSARMDAEMAVLLEQWTKAGMLRWTEEVGVTVCEIIDVGSGRTCGVGVARRDFADPPNRSTGRRIAFTSAMQEIINRL